MKSRTRPPNAFQQKKKWIVDQLSIPDVHYGDRSPKGSVDEGIRQLVRQILDQDGLVTTSSCAGRVSVFLEGRKKVEGMVMSEIGVDGGHVELGAPAIDVPDGFKQPSMKPATPGGKGGGGKWLYLSHDPVSLHADTAVVGGHCTDLFGLSKHSTAVPAPTSEETRYVHFKFEAMVCDTEGYKTSDCTQRAN